VVGIMALPASLMAGILWQGAGSWAGLGPAAPFLAGAALSGVACLMLAFQDLRLHSGEAPDPVA